MKQFSALILASLLSAACVSSAPPPQPPPTQPPVAQPTPPPTPPTVAPTPPGPLLKWCDPDAPPVYSETVRRRNQPIANQVKFVLRQRGAWSYSVGNKLLKTGCVLRNQYGDFIRTLHGANFRPPPRQHATCDALTERFIGYFDMRRRTRSAFSSTPCGSRANPDVYKVSALIHKYVGPSPAAPVVAVKPPSYPPKPPGPVAPRCLAMHTWGRVIYMEQTRSFRFRGGVGAGAPSRPRRMPRKPIAVRPQRTLTVYANGAWRSTGYGKAKTGCLSRANITQMHRLLRSAQFRTDPRQRIRCRAIPSMTTTISSRSKRFSFSHPCGAALHPTLARLRNFVFRHVRR